MNTSLRFFAWFVMGAFGLCLFSTVQKLAVGFPLTPQTFVAPFVFGGLSIGLLGLRHDRVRQVKQELEKANAQLEIRVADRTSELGRVNDALLKEIAEHRQAEEALRQNEQRLNLALKGADLGMWDWNIQTGAIAINQRWATMLGYRIEQINPHIDSWQDLVHPDDKKRVMVALDDHLDGKTAFFEAEYRLKSADGSWKWILDKGKVIERDHQANPLRACGTHLDITGRVHERQKRLVMERQIQQARKAESLARMAGAVAHHFNNQLNVVMGNLELASEDLPADTTTRGYLCEAMQAARRSAEISGLMLTYLGKNAGKPEPVDLSAFCRQQVPVLQDALPGGITLETDLMVAGPLVQVCADQMRQVLTHLITNAAEAIGDHNGKVVLTTRTIAGADIPTSRLIPADWQPDANSFACLEVKDTGCGVSPENMDKLFDPFFTTNFTGRGLGLAVVLGIVRAWDGAIHVASDQGQGTTFCIYLPLLAQ